MTEQPQPQKQFIIVLVSPSGGQVPLADCLPDAFRNWQVRLVEQQPESDDNNSRQIEQNNSE